MLTTGTKFIVAAPNSDVVIDNSVVTLSTYFRNSGMFTLQNGSVMTGATIQFGENGGNNGTIIVDNSDLTITASSTGHALDGKGTGKIELTGSLGDVMQESAKAAITCIRSRCSKYNIDADFYKNKDIHIHAPEGAVPKDGPSAGITMATAICSALTNTNVKHNIAMTGEITLRGRVLPIGGLKEKAIAAYKNNIRTVLIPKGNVPDLAEIDPIVRNNVEFIPVESIDEVLSVALVSKTSKIKTKAKTTADSRANQSI